MSLCSPCTKVKNLPKCVNQIIVGTITNLNTAVYVYLKNIATGRIERYSATSSGAGLVTIDTSATGFDTELEHEIWITLQSATSIYDKLNITIGTTIKNCFSLSFDDVSVDDEQIAFTSQTLAI